VSGRQTYRYPHGPDLDLIPFDLGPARDRGSFELTADLARQDGILYGGTGAAAAVMAMESATQRDALWVVTQFLAPAEVGERIHWAVDTLAKGRHVAQVHVAATVGDRLIFCALGATGTARPHGITGQFDAMPHVTPPEDSPVLRHRFGHNRHFEFREATFGGPQPPGRLALWARLTSSAILTRASIAYLADKVPMAISRGAGTIGMGRSLDNSLRFAVTPSTGWVLLDLLGQVACDGYGHGSLAAWSTDGTLVATGSQTATMTLMLDGEDAAKRLERSV
jgi:acyl-CoA thioesterase